tara:strand:+ start:668 stop:1495 length:828 start_codon:yes stop_codon:yes gene_type:complete
MLSTALRHTLLTAALRAVPPAARRPAVRCCGSAPPASGVPAALGEIRQRLAEAADGSSSSSTPRLVAVSKTKPAELLLEAYDAGQRDFGENYVQELVEKAPQLAERAPDIAWRFIGKLQSNKAKPLLQGVPGLVAVETVTSSKLADKLQTAAAAAKPPRAKPLDVFLQIDTSPWEGTKNGLTPDEALTLASHIVAGCPALRLAGLMTIGAPGDSSCFDTLRACRESLAEKLSVPAESLELSMGMSGDFEEAIRAGSTSVRVGSSIFGARDYPAKA